ncbi:MAG: flagellar basal-body MS-ring/collar protein FliF [Gammaproteobacteria bacterium]
MADDGQSMMASGGASVTSLSILRQIGLMVGLAASVALGVVLVLWSQEPDKRPMGEMDAATMYEVVSYLDQNKISYEIGPTGALLVDQGQYQRVQMALASQGLSDTMGGDSILQTDSGFGVSQQLENARLNRSREKSLAATIVKFSGVTSAEVHLAIPKQTVFVTDRRRPSASVLLNLASSRPIDDQQTRAIVDLVAGSVPNLTADRITITDQFGRLHHSGTMSSEEMQSKREFEEESKRQQVLRTKIESILAPILGIENFTVQVNVRMRFVANETTSRFHNADSPSLRSERKLISSDSSGTASGVPGALSNQPPGAANIPATGANAANAAQTGANGNQRSETESNYELDTTINHTRYQTANIDRISVSLGLNNLVDEEGARISRSANEVQRIERLIKGVINFDASRGDSVIVDTFDFPLAELPPEPEPLAFYEEELFKTMLKPAVAFVLVLLLILFVFRPVISKLTTGTMQMLEPDYNPNLASDTLSLGSDMGGMAMAPIGRKSMAQVERAKSAVGDDPAMVAQVVKNWMEADE